MSSEWCWKEVKSNTKSNNVGAGVDGSDGDKYLYSVPNTNITINIFTGKTILSPPLPLPLHRPSLCL